jgi:Ni/Fe-hydrogenase 1 B-type cytochrome subunit
MANVVFKGIIMDNTQIKEKGVDENIKMELEFTPFYRWHHWIRVLSIVVLLVTGFYISVPFIIPAVNAEPTNFVNAEFRAVHQIFGFVMISMFIGKTYYFFFSKKNRMEINSFKDLFSVKNWVSQVGYYLFISKHPKLSGAYNVVQLMAYFIFYIAITGLIITGLILYVHNYHNGLGGLLYGSMRYLEAMSGGMAFIRELHHVLMWGVILFIVGHIYMVVFNAVYGKEGTVDSIFSGYRWKRKH